MILPYAICVAKSVTCQTIDVYLTADPGVAS